MRISGHGQETFLFLNGLVVTRTLQLEKNVELLPASCSPTPESIIKVSRTKTDLGIATIFLHRVTSQIHVVAQTPKELAERAWNSLWDAILLSALFDCYAVCNLQCNTCAESFSIGCQLEVTNYHLRGLTDKPYIISNEEADWIEQNFWKAINLLEKPAFLNSVHSMASYRWHPHPRAQLAVIWSGIEGLFEVKSELVFRLSLYAARFLAPDDEVERSKIFADVKHLYKKRSKAVHGSTIKGDSGVGVEESAQLLLKLIRRCVTCNDLPCIEKLAP